MTDMTERISAELDRTDARANRIIEKEEACAKALPAAAVKKVLRCIVCSPVQNNIHVLGTQAGFPPRQSSLRSCCTIGPSRARGDLMARQQIALRLCRYAVNLPATNPREPLVLARRPGNLGLLHPLRFLHQAPVKLDLLQVSRGLLEINVAPVLHGLVRNLQVLGAHVDGPQTAFVTSLVQQRKWVRSSGESLQQRRRLRVWRVVAPVPHRLTTSESI